MPPNPVTLQDSLLNAGAPNFVASSDVGLVSMPPEIILDMAKYMNQSTKCKLARTCRGLSILMRTALYDYDEYQDYGSFWWACATNNTAVVEHHIRRDPSLVNFCFRRPHMLPAFVQGFAVRYASRLRSTLFSQHLVPIMVAIAHGSFDVFALLLREGAVLSIAVSCLALGEGARFLPVHFASKLLRANHGYENCLRYLVRYGADINQAPISTRAIGVFEEGVPLFDQLTFDSSMISRRVNRNPVADFTAVISERLRKAISLLRVGADPNRKDPSSSHVPLLRIAAALDLYDPQSHWDDLHVRLRHEIQELYDTVIVPYGLEFVKVLLKYGADPLGYYVNESPLHILCKHNQLYEPIIHCLIDAGADINASDMSGRTPLFNHVLHPRTAETLENFIKKGANVNHRDVQGRTPLHLVCSELTCSQVQLEFLVETLVKYDADTTIEDKSGRTARDRLIQREIPAPPEIISFLNAAELNDTVRAKGAAERDENFGDDE